MKIITDLRKTLSFILIESLSFASKTINSEGVNFTCKQNWIILNKQESSFIYKSIIEVSGLHGVHSSVHKSVHR